MFHIFLYPEVNHFIYESSLDLSNCMKVGTLRYYPTTNKNGSIKAGP